MKAQLYPKTLVLLCLSLTILLVAGCNNEDPEPGLPDLQVYIDKFESEAASRGYDYDLSGIEVAYMDEVSVNGRQLCAVGFSNYNGLGVRRIEISKFEGCGWADLTEAQREALFFQQIGFAFLGRPYTRALLCDGSPMSLMSNDFPRLFAGYEVEENQNYYITELIERDIDGQCVSWKSTWSNDTAFYQYHPDERWSFEDHDGDFIGVREGDNMLSIELAPGRTADDGGKWFTTIYPNLPECSQVTFKVTLNSDGLDGRGAAVSLRVFERGEVARTGVPDDFVETMFLTTTDRPVSGKLDNHVEELTIPCLSRDTYYIVLFVRLLSETTGKVSFSDVRMVVDNLEE